MLMYINTRGAVSFFPSSSRQYFLEKSMFELSQITWNSQPILDILTLFLVHLDDESIEQIVNRLPEHYRSWFLKKGIVSLLPKHLRAFFEGPRGVELKEEKKYESSGDRSSDVKLVLPPLIGQDVNKIYDLEAKNGEGTAAQWGNNAILSVQAPAQALPSELKLQLLQSRPRRRASGVESPKQHTLWHIIEKKGAKMIAYFVHPNFVHAVTSFVFPKLSTNLKVLSCCMGTVFGVQLLLSQRARRISARWTTVFIDSVSFIAATAALTTLFVLYRDHTRPRRLYPGSSHTLVTENTLWARKQKAFAAFIVLGSWLLWLLRSRRTPQVVSLVLSS